MKFALFLGCNIPARLKDYDLSARAVLEKLGVELVDIQEFNCCGYPVRNYDSRTFLLSAARNLALVDRLDLPMLILCKCCYGSLKKADHTLRNSRILQGEINELLSVEGLRYKGATSVKHFLSVLYHDIGIERIKESILRPFKDLKIATHYGCHALRPSSVVEFDNPIAPTLFDELVEATGAKSIDWSTKLECCGAPLMGINDRLSMDLTLKKLADGKNSGADFLSTACPYCQMQFETVRHSESLHASENSALPAILYAELLGRALGIDIKKLTIQKDHRDVTGIETFLT